MIHLLGDIHGNFRRFWNIVQEIREEDTIIQVGDFGAWPQLEESFNKAKWAHPARRKGDIFFIDGNHDYIPMLPVDAPEMVEVWKNTWFMPRGYVGMVEDKRTLFLGGSKSVDRKWRHCGSLDHGWFPEEQLTNEQAHRAVANALAFGKIDLMITHTPPAFIAQKHLSPDGLRWFDIDPNTWKDESAELVQWVWNQLGQPKLVSGHLHRSIVDGDVRVLGIEEVYKLEEK